MTWPRRRRRMNDDYDTDHILRGDLPDGGAGGGAVHRGVQPHRLQERPRQPLRLVQDHGVSQ